MQPHERVICALDLPDPAEARGMVQELEGVIGFFKVGMLLFLTGGREMVRWILSRGHRVFLDLKYYDVPDTVGAAVSQVSTLGANFLTVHGNRAIMAAAAGAARASQLKLLAVTVLTSLDEDDIRAMGYPCSLDDLVAQRARAALDLGFAGVVASPREAALLRGAFGPGPVLVTPGIRPSGAAAGGHKRAATPREALHSGADYLVVGQPIITASNPRAAAQAIVEELAAAKKMQPGQAFPTG